jgi:phage baseplate assembly protein W
MAKTFSIEDGNTSVSTIFGSRKRKYSDIDLTFTSKSVSKDIFKKEDAAAVKQAVKNLCMTNLNEKPFLPDFGANIQGMLFELADADTEEEIEDQVIASINKYEPRAKVLNVLANSLPDINSIDVKITFQVINTQEEVSVSIVLARLR